MGAFLGLLAKGIKGYGKSVGRGIRSDLEQGVQGILDPLQRRKKPDDIGLPVPETGEGTFTGAPVETLPWDEDYGLGAPNQAITLPPTVQPDLVGERRKRRLGILDDINPYGGIF